MAVEGVWDTGETVRVYNLQIAEYHTYFVGTSEWGFSVWAHNAYNVEQLGELGQRARQLKGLTKSKIDTVGIVKAVKPDGTIVNIISMSSKKRVPQAILDALGPNEIAIKGTLLHAEKSGLIYAARQGWQPLEVAASMGICPSCARWINFFGAIPVSPLR
jgi:hypothetical protein